MRVGLVIYGSLDTLSGGYLYDRTLVEHLSKRGDHVEIVSLPWRSYPRHLGDNLNAALARRLDRLDVDILLEDELNHPSLALHNRRLLWQGRFPVLSIVHHLRSSELHPSWLAPLYRLVERHYLRGVEGFVFNSRTTRRAVEALRGLCAPGVIATPGGDRFGRTGEAEMIARSRNAGPLRMLFAGNLIPRKGLHTLLAALRLLPTTGWELHVAGRDDLDPSYTVRLRRMAAPFGQRVRFLGRLPDGALAEEMRAAHVLVAPSTYEGFGIVYLEGMACGLPGIATSAGAAEEIVENGVSGFIVPPEDPPELARAMASLLIDREKLLAMRLAARRRYLDFPTWEETAEKIREYLYTWL